MRELVRDFRRWSSRLFPLMSALSLVAVLAVCADADQGTVLTADEYVAYVDAYASGQRTEAVAGVLRIALASLASTQDQVFDRMDGRIATALDDYRRGRATRDRFDVERAARVRTGTRALALHVDALSFAQKVWQLEAQFKAARSAIARLKRLEEDLEQNGPVFDLEWRRLAAASAVPMKEEQARRGRREWLVLRGVMRQAYLTLVSYLQDRGMLAPLEGLVGEALAFFPDDPSLLLARGSYHESIATQMVVDTSVLDQIYPGDHLRRRRDVLGRAEADLREAWTREPALVEAVLRLGRVRQLQGHATEARADFDTVGRQPAGPDLRYLALMFRAELTEQDGDAVSADQLYRESLALMPVAQAPSLALSRLADSRGDLRDARRWLQRSFVAVGPGREDPWWEYLQGQGRLLGERLERLREMALQ